MKTSLSLSLLFLTFAAAPAPAQNLWPVSFRYWCSYPDPYFPDLLGADHSMAHADQMARLDDHGIRGLMLNRNQTMSQHELEGYHRANMLPAIYPTDDESQTQGPKPSPAANSDSPPASAAPPARSTSPFPSTQPPGGSSAPAQPAPRP